METSYQKHRRWARETSRSAAKVRPLRDAIRKLLKSEMACPMSTTSKGRVLHHISEGLSLEIQHKAHSPRGVLVEYKEGFRGFMSKPNVDDAKMRDINERMEAILKKQFGERVSKNYQGKLFVALVEDYTV